jgi:hypothetical protein
MRQPTLLLLAAALLAGCSYDARDGGDSVSLIAPVFASAKPSDHFKAHASGRDEVPANSSRAQGQAQFWLSDDGESIRYRLIVANIHNVTQAHIHRGAPGVSGGIVVWLYPAAPPAQLIPGRTQGVLFEGTITDADVVGTLLGQGLEGLLREIRAGNTYVNIHTLQFPPGEIRGQID